MGKKSELEGIFKKRKTDTHVLNSYSDWQSLQDKFTGKSSCSASSLGHTTYNIWDVNPHVPLPIFPPEYTVWNDDNAPWISWVIITLTLLALTLIKLFRFRYCRLRHLQWYSYDRVGFWSYWRGSFQLRLSQICGLSHAQNCLFFRPQVIWLVRMNAG